MTHPHTKEVPDFATSTAETSPALAPYDLRGCMEDGYTPDKVNSALGQLSDLSGHQLVCVWDYWDGFGFGGHSDFYIEDADGRTLRYVAGDLWVWLNRPANDPTSPDTPGDPAGWVGAVVTDFTIDDISGGDNFHNYAIRNDE